MKITHSFKVFRCMFGATVEVNPDQMEIRKYELFRVLTRKWS